MMTDPGLDPYIVLSDPDPGGPAKTSGSGSESATMILSCIKNNGVLCLTPPINAKLRISPRIFVKIIKMAPKGYSGWLGGETDPCRKPEF